MQVEVGLFHQSTYSSSFTLPDNKTCTKGYPSANPSSFALLDVYKINNNQYLKFPPIQNVGRFRFIQRQISLTSTKFILKLKGQRHRSPMSLTLKETHKHSTESLQIWL